MGFYDAFKDALGVAQKADNVVTLSSTFRFISPSS